MEPLRLRQAPQDSRILNQPTSTADSPSEEAVADTDEPPDGKQLARTKQANDQFKKIRYQMQRNQSLLTQRLQSSESDSQHDDEDIFSASGRAHSTTSTWSRGSVASTAELTSDGHTSPVRSSTPSPPLPRAQGFPLPPVFNTKPFSTPSTVTIVQDAVDPLRAPAPLSANEDKVEAGLGRKRCIMFACRKKEETKKEDAGKAENIKPTEQPAQPAKRPCALTFACPTRSPAPTTTNKPHVRLASPAPPRRLPQSPKPNGRIHLGSDATVRTTSPKTVRKVPSVVRARRASAASQEADQYEATRFHAFASSEEERDDWTQEATCHRTRLTVEDTLKVENNLRKLVKEVDDEALEEDEEEELDQGNGDEEEDIDDEDDDNESIGMVDSIGYVTDEGFQTDDEEGFAGSDDDSDAGSDYAWWAPGHSGGEHVEHIRHIRPRSDSGSSRGSFSSTRVLPSKTPKMVRRKKTHPVDFRPRTPELPDSTDFVCGTLDEDRPLEQAYISCLVQRRAAKHKLVPQDIDPTFPTSDPEMDDQDEDEDEDDVHVDESDSHLMFLHDAPDPSDTDSREPRDIVPKKRSPIHSPKRMRSPPPTKRTTYHSPPPRHKQAQSPKRFRSPPPARLRSPPPTIRRASFAKHLEDMDATPVALKGRPRLGRGASSLPRNGVFALQRLSSHRSALNDDNAEDVSNTENLPTRGAIDIVKGLEKKRQRRREKMLEKHCRLRNKGNQKKHPHVVLAGRGVERMKEMGMELAALRGKRPTGSPTEQGQHILSC